MLPQPCQWVACHSPSSYLSPAIAHRGENTLWPDITQPETRRNGSIAMKGSDRRFMVLRIMTAPSDGCCGGFGVICWPFFELPPLTQHWKRESKLTFERVLVGHSAVKFRILALHCFQSGHSKRVELYTKYTMLWCLFLNVSCCNFHVSIVSPCAVG